MKYVVLISSVCPHQPPFQPKLPAYEVRGTSVGTITIRPQRQGSSCAISRSVSKDLWRRFRHNLKLGSEFTVHHGGGGYGRRKSLRDEPVPPRLPLSYSEMWKILTIASPRPSHLRHRTICSGMLIYNEGRFPTPGTATNSSQSVPPAGPRLHNFPLEASELRRVPLGWSADVDCSPHPPATLLDRQDRDPETISPRPIRVAAPHRPPGAINPTPRYI